MLWVAPVVLAAGAVAALGDRRGATTAARERPPTRCATRSSCSLASLDDARAEHDARRARRRRARRDRATRRRAARRGARLASPALASAARRRRRSPAPAGDRRRPRAACSSSPRRALTIAVAVVVLAAVNPFAAAPAPLRVTTRPSRSSGCSSSPRRLVADGDAAPGAHRLRRGAALDPRERRGARRERVAALRARGSRAAPRQAGCARVRRALPARSSSRRDAAAAHLYDGIVLYQHDQATAPRRSTRSCGRATLPESQFEQSVTADVPRDRSSLSD